MGEMLFLRGYETSNVFALLSSTNTYTLIQMPSCFFFTCILTLVTQPFSLQSMVSGMPEPDAPAKADGALWMSVGGVRLAKNCRISSSVYDKENTNDEMRSKSQSQLADSYQSFQLQYVL